jgi:signal transduction histidine kinase
MSFETPLWRALSVFRALALGYVVVLYAGSFPEYARPALGWVVIGAMAAWTVFTAWAYGSPRRRRWPLLTADLAVGCATVLLTRVVDTTARIEAGEATLPTIWSVAPVFAWATWAGWRGGLVSAVVLAIADWIERGAMTGSTLHNIVLVLLGGLVVGYLVDRARQGQVALERALALEAATREPERLARTIHDGVLQVLALVQRRGAEIGGPAAELGRLAGEQEASLRALVRSSPDLLDRDATTAGTVTDLRALLTPMSSARVTVAAPATPVLMPADEAQEKAAAVNAALDNVAQHAGRDARAWVLLEQERSAGTRCGAGHRERRRSWTDAAAVGGGCRGRAARSRPVHTGAAARSRRSGHRHVGTWGGH